MENIKSELSDNYTEEMPVQESFAEHMRKLAEKENAEKVSIKTEIPEEIQPNAEIQHSDPKSEVFHKLKEKFEQILMQDRLAKAKQLIEPEQAQEHLQQFLIKEQISKAQKIFQENPETPIATVQQFFSKSYPQPVDQGLLNALRNQALTEKQLNSLDQNAQIERQLTALINTSLAQGKRLSTEFVQSKALQMMKEVGSSMDISWINRYIAQNGHKLAKTSPRRAGADKRKSFVRLTFGEKHEISCFIIKNPKWPVRAYAEHFTKLWDRNVTQKQIEVTKDNKKKWSDPQYKNVSQSYEKFVRKSSIRLSRSEREEIAKYIQHNGNMTLEETARYFTRLWNKDVNRTHIARIKNHTRMALDHDDDFEFREPHHHSAMPSYEERGLAVGTNIPPPIPSIPANPGLQWGLSRPERPQAPPLRHQLFGNLPFGLPFKIQPNNNNQQFLSNQNYEYQQLQLQKQADDRDSGVSVGSSISPTSVEIREAPKFPPARTSVIMSTKSALLQTKPAENLERCQPETKIFNCPQCDWQTFDKSKFWEHIRADHIEVMALPNLTLSGVKKDEEPEIIDIKTQPLDSDDVIMMS